MLQDISYFYILGIPFIVYLGIITIGFFLITALLAILKRKNMIKMSVKWHYRLAFLSIVLGIFHSILGVLIYI
jgi:dolichyl-phosphate-mannose--protein O-mannosyl transferase